MNDTMGPNGLVPSFLVFGVLPRFPFLHTTLPNQIQRMRALQAGRTEMETVVSELRVRQAMLSKIPRCVDTILKPGDLVRVYRETDKKYVGPYPVIRVDGKQVYLFINGKEVQHGVHQILPAKEYDRITKGEEQIGTLYAMIKQFTSRPIHSCIKPYSAHIVEILKPSDPRSHSKEAKEAKLREIEGLINKGTWKVVIEDEVPENANILTGHFVVCLLYTSPSPRDQRGSRMPSSA